MVMMVAALTEIKEASITDMIKICFNLDFKDIFYREKKLFEGVLILNLWCIKFQSRRYFHSRHPFPELILINTRPVL